MADRPEQPGVALRLAAIEHRLAIGEERDRQADEQRREDARRSARTEERVADQGRQLTEMNQKLDKLLTAAAMSKGAWWMLMKICGGLVFLGGIVMWAADHFRWWVK